MECQSSTREFRFTPPRAGTFCILVMQPALACENRYDRCDESVDLTRRYPSGSSRMI